MSDIESRTITVWMTGEDQERLARLTKQTGLSKSGLVRRLLIKADEGDGSQTAELREVVAQLARIVL